MTSRDLHSFIHFVFFVCCFFPRGKKQSKKKGGTTKKGVPRDAGAPPRLIACPPSKAIGALFEALTRQPLLDFGSFGRSLAAGNTADCGRGEQVVSTSCGDWGEAQSLSEFQTVRCLLCFVCCLFCLLFFIVFALCFVCFLVFFFGFVFLVGCFLCFCFYLLVSRQ